MNARLGILIFVLVAVPLAGYFGRERLRRIDPADLPRVAVTLASEDDQVKLAEALIVRQEREAAHRILDGKTSPLARRARSRLAIFEADCERAYRELDSEAVRKLDGVREMLAFSERCARATVGGVVVADEKLGIWLRLQDEADRVLAPFLLDAFGRALPILERELGATLPRPLRIDVVRDLFSLSAVSGLPLESAETTGTVAVAKFGRVTFLSPRAIARGFPWEDTVAHEITHLVISKATHDRAPLWLQEGVAKRYETRYRKERPFDRSPDPALVAYRALVSGTSVGIDRLGPSIAMLSSGDAATIAFAEVTSFIDFWLEKNGPGALRALFSEMRAGADERQSLVGVSGYSLADWQVIYRDELRRRFEGKELGDEVAGHLEGVVAYRAGRTVELLDLANHPKAAAAYGAPFLEEGGRDAELRFLVGRAGKRAERLDTRGLLGDLSQVDGPNAGHLALLSGRNELPAFVAEKGDPLGVSGGSGPLPSTEELLTQARALDPLLLEVACAGSKENYEHTLCEHVRTLPRRGSE